MSFLGKHKMKNLLGFYDVINLGYYLLTIELSDSINLGLRTGFLRVRFREVSL
jgi:hypothetical protein